MIALARLWAAWVLLRIGGGSLWLAGWMIGGGPRQGPLRFVRSGIVSLSLAVSTVAADLSRRLVRRVLLA
jgi:hypothetical protein